MKDNNKKFDEYMRDRRPDVDAKEQAKPILCAKCNDHIIADDGAICIICAATQDTIIAELQVRIAELEAERDECKNELIRVYAALGRALARIYDAYPDIGQDLESILEKEIDVSEGDKIAAKMEQSVMAWRRYPDEAPLEEAVYLVAYRSKDNVMTVNLDVWYDGYWAAYRDRVIYWRAILVPIEQEEPAKCK